MRLTSILAELPTEPIYQETWDDSAPVLYLLLGIGFFLTLIVAAVFIYIMSRKGE